MFIQVLIFWYKRVTSIGYVLSLAAKPTSRHHLAWFVRRLRSIGVEGHVSEA